MSTLSRHYFALLCFKVCVESGVKLSPRSVASMPITLSSLVKPAANQDRPPTQIDLMIGFWESERLEHDGGFSSRCLGCSCENDPRSETGQDQSQRTSKLNEAILQASRDGEMMGVSRLGNHATINTSTQL